MFDVAVIGAGPVGSRVARNMAELGFSTVVFDRKKRLNEPVCCTGIVSREFVEKYGIDDKVIYRDANSASIYSPSGTLLHVQRDAPQASILDRAGLNDYLGKLAMDKGAEYVLDSRVTGIEKTDDSVKLNTETREGKKLIVEARVIVIAGGFGSKLTEMAGLGKAGDFAMGVQAEVEARNLEEVQVFLGNRLAPGFFGWLVPTTQGRALAGLITRNNTSRYMKKFLSVLADNGSISGRKPNVSFAGVALKDIRKTSTDRILVAGSAAGQVKPLTGGGVYFGMLCADIATETLKRALEADNLTAKCLANYDKEWKKVIGRETKLGHWSRKFYELLNDRQIDNIIDMTMSSGIVKTLLDSDDMKFDWHGKIVLKLLRIKTLTGIVKSIGNPFR